MNDLENGVDRIGDAFDVIGHPCRRAALVVLDRNSPPVPLERLAAGVRERHRESDGRIPAVREAIAVELHHRHLPKLDDARLLEYRPSSTAIVDWSDLDLPEGWVAEPSVDPLLSAMATE